MIHFLLCGVSETRLWPVPRKNFPKQFCKIIAHKSRLQYFVMKNTNQYTTQTLIKNKEIVFLTMIQIEKMSKSTKNVRYVLESVRTNTAPTIAIGCLMCGIENIILVTSADHMIQNLPEYDKALSCAHEEDKAEYLVPFGIKNISPEIWHRYTEGDGADSMVNNVVCFKGESDLKTAEEYLKSCKYYRNNKKVKLLPSLFIWNYFGCNDALFAKLPATESGNTELGHHININSYNSVLFSDKVVSTIDTEIPTAYRSLGSYTVLEEWARFRMKHIVVKPGNRLSLQNHNRSVYLVMVSGSTIVIKREMEYLIESIDISLYEVHRIENTKKRAS